jgi:hypothetical protein
LIYGGRQADLLVILSRRQHTMLSAMLSQIHDRGSCSIWWAIWVRHWICAHGWDGMNDIKRIRATDYWAWQLSIAYFVSKGKNKHERMPSCNDNCPSRFSYIKKPVHGRDNMPTAQQQVITPQATEAHQDKVEKTRSVSSKSVSNNQPTTRKKE